MNMAQFRQALHQPGIVRVLSEVSGYQTVYIYKCRKGYRVPEHAIRDLIQALPLAQTVLQQKQADELRRKHLRELEKQKLAAEKEMQLLRADMRRLQRRMHSIVEELKSLGSGGAV